MSNSLPSSPKRPSILKSVALRGTLWIVISYGLSQGLRLISNVILARLLTRDIFGLMSLVNVYIIGLNLFSDIGIGPTIVQNRRGDEPLFLNTVWTLQVLRGIGIWVACYILAILLGLFYNLRLLMPLAIAGYGVLITGFNSTSLATLQRYLEVGRSVRIALVIQFISTGITLIWAWWDRSVWALVGGGLVSNTVNMVWSHHLQPKIKNRLSWDSTAIAEIFQFGKWISLSSAMTFLADNADRLILGGLISLEDLGVYSIALTFANIPREIIGRVSGQILFPIVAQQQDVPAYLLREKILKKRRLILLLLIVGLATLVSFGDWPIRLLYKKEYFAASWMLPVLALGIWPRVLSLTISPLLLAKGKSIYAAMATSLKFLYMILVLPISYAYFGAVGAIVVVAFNDLPIYGMESYGLWREGFSGFHQDVWATLALLLLIGFMCQGRLVLGLGLPISSPLSL